MPKIHHPTRVIDGQTYYLVPGICCSHCAFYQHFRCELPYDRHTWNDCISPSYIYMPETVYRSKPYLLRLWWYLRILLTY